MVSVLAVSRFSSTTGYICVDMRLLMKDSWILSLQHQFVRSLEFDGTPSRSDGTERSMLTLAMHNQNDN